MHRPFRRKKRNRRHDAPNRSRRRRLRIEPLEPRQLLAADIVVFAAGRTGEERIELQIDGAAVATFENVGGDYENGLFEELRYTHPTDVDASQIRVVFTNNAFTTGGADRDLRVDGVSIDGVKHESEDADVFAVGGGAIGGGCTSGYLQTEILRCDGYFAYDQQGTVVQVHAAGRTGEETAALQIDGVTVATFTNVGGDYESGVFETFSYVHPTSVAANQVRVAFTNNAFTRGGADRDLRVDGVSIDGVKHESEDSDVFAVGIVVPGVAGCNSGFWQTEFLRCDGYVEFESSANAGQLGVQLTSIDVDEDEGSVTVNVVRSGGSEGTIALDYATENNSAISGVDYLARSGRLFFAPGETVQAIVVPIVNDLADESDENFFVTADAALGGATISPSADAATVTIVDDDVPGQIGTVLEILAAGRTGEETAELQIDGVTVATFRNIGGDYDDGV
ncbi:MAG: carbohydrate-binding domain-containing protein, partial [Planctomycetota bacterium]